jgi:hypothetical protein
MQGYFNFLATGDTPVPAAIMAVATGRPSEASWWDYAVDIRARTMVYRSNTWLLKHQTKMVEAAQLPGSARYHALRDIELDFREFAKTRDYDLTLARLMAAAVMFRLWDPDHRRQPPLPSRPKADDDA